MATLDSFYEPDLGQQAQLVPDGGRSSSSSSAVLGFAIGYAIIGSPAGGVGRHRRSRWRSARLGGSGRTSAATSSSSTVSGAREVDETPAPQLMNVVREMAIAANVPMPKVYIIDDTAPNAFATGRDPAHASVAITTGLLEKLDREELQGVIGHELSHVRNFDIRFSLIVGVMVGAIAILADFFLRFTFWGGVGGRRASSRDSGGNGAQAVIVVVAIVLAILAPIISRFIQLAVSRQREYLADASSRRADPQPVRPRAGAGQDRRPTRRSSRSPTAATQHMYFTNPIKKFEARSSGLMVDPPADPRPDQPAPPADRRAAARRRPRRRHWPGWTRAGSATVAAPR